MTIRKQSYNELMTELKLIVSQMQSSTLDIDDSLAKYSRAKKLLDELDKYLQSAENTITNHKLQAKD